MDRQSDNPIIVVVGQRRGVLNAVAVRRARRSLAASLVLHLAVAGVAVTLASVLDLRLAAFGNNRPLSITAALDEQSEAVAEPGETGPHQIVIKPTEAWQDDRHFLNTTVLPNIDRAADVPSRAAVRPSLDTSTNVRPNHAVRPETPRRHATTPRRRAAASVEPTIAPVALPPPDIRFVGRPCRYPAVALEAGWEGEVLLHVTIDADGAVTGVEIAKSSGYPVFDAEAVQTARAWRAVPNKPGGKLWPGQFLKPIQFRLQ
ncbi:MAG: energy transducer TonB [Pirellulales bacterium]